MEDRHDENPDSHAECEDPATRYATTTRRGGDELSSAMMNDDHGGDLRRAYLGASTMTCRFGAITLFLLIMGRPSLGSLVQLKLTDRWGRKRCFFHCRVSLLYGIGVSLVRLRRLPTSAC